MPKNIKDITLWDSSDSVNKKGVRYNNIPLVRINFNFPCSYTILGIEDIKEILRLWIIGEEEKYPQSEGFRGRWLFFEEIKKIFEETK